MVHPAAVWAVARPRIRRVWTVACLDPDAAWREPVEELVYERVNASGAAQASSGK